MLTIKVVRYNKNGHVKKDKLVFKGTREELLEIERLYDLAEESFIDQGENWR